MRGEAASGFPSLRYLALPALQTALSERKTLEQAGLHALLHLMAGVQDTNLAARGAPEIRSGHDPPQPLSRRLRGSAGNDIFAALFAGKRGFILSFVCICFQNR